MKTLQIIYNIENNNPDCLHVIIDDDDFRYFSGICNALKKNTIVTSLSIFCNDVQEKEIISNLIDVFDVNNTIRTLYLCGRFRETNLGKKLGEILKKNKLNELIIDTCDMNDMLQHHIVQGKRESEEANFGKYERKEEK